jgi:molybdopterin converting factor small subunit
VPLWFVSVFFEVDMSVKIEVPTMLREHTGGDTVVTVEGTTVGLALAELTIKHPALKTKLFDGDRLRPHINIFIDGEDIRYLDDLETALKGGEMIVLLPAVAGG